MAKKRPTLEEKRWMNKVASYGCVACLQDGIQVPAEIHHIRKHTGMGLSPSHFNVIGLCSRHHRTGKISVHLGKKAFIEKYGTEQQLEKNMRERIEEWEIIQADIF